MNWKNPPAAEPQDLEMLLLQEGVPLVQPQEMGRPQQNRSQFKNRHDTKKASILPTGRGLLMHKVCYHTHATKMCAGPQIHLDLSAF